MWVQTGNPQHPLFAALRAHDFAAFAGQLLNERRASALPPYTHLALVRAEATQAATALAFLQEATQSAVDMPEAQAVTIYPGVPHAILRVADVERVQMLVESVSRPALQKFLAAWLPQLQGLRAAHKGLRRWAVDVDPAAI